MMRPFLLVSLARFYAQMSHFLPICGDSIKLIFNAAYIVNKSIVYSLNDSYMEREKRYSDK